LSKIKVGIVSYLNTRPLIYGLKLEPIASQIELVEDNPARLAEMLKNNEIDLGLIPVAAIHELKNHIYPEIIVLALKVRQHLFVCLVKCH
jgi:chorismate dehydratase